MYVFGALLGLPGGTATRCCVAVHGALGEQARSRNGA
jgi:hypothetical protein